MSELGELVRNANARFYLALGQGDLAAMAAVWLHTDDAICVHPGWSPIRGWKAIRESWAGIFEHQGLLRVWPSRVQTAVAQTTAIVSCIENIDVTATAGGGIVQARARNRFVLYKGKWRMVEHHAEPIPAFQSTARVEPFSAN